jgi:hypothetical protein
LIFDNKDKFSIKIPVNFILKWIMLQFCNKKPFFVIEIYLFLQ